MGLSEEIVAALREKYRAGATFAELANEADVSLTYLRKLMVGERDPMKLSLDFFLRLFPSAQISLAGSAQATPVSGDSLRHERELLELERALLAAERRELEQTRKNLELEKENLELRAQSLSSTPRAHHAAEPVAPYRFAPAQESTLSPSK